MTGAGQRRERVTFSRRAEDENGDRLGPWGDAFTRWARVKALKGGEAVIQARMQGIAPVEITVLADTATRGLTSEWRAMWQGVAYNLTAPAPSENRAEIAFMAQADQSEEGPGVG